MKRAIVLGFGTTLLLAASVTSVLRGQDELPLPALKDPFPNSTDKISYAVGQNFGKNLKKMGVKLNVEQVLHGISDVLGDAQPKLSDDQLRDAIAAFERAAAEVQKQLGERFLVENAKQPGVTKLANGLQYQVIKSGDGPTPQISDRVRVHYRGSLIDGTEFDSSYSRGPAATLPVGGVIRGWMDALLRMKVGDQWKLFVPPELAYGELGAPPRIGPNSVLVFEIELLGIEADE